MNVAVVVYGLFEEDLHEKSRWANVLQCEYGHDVAILARGGPDTISAATRGGGGNSSITMHPYYLSKFSDTYDYATWQEKERWLGVPFRHLQAFDRNFYDRKTARDTRDTEKLNNLTTGLVSFLADFFERNKTDVIVLGIEDYLFHVVSYYVAQKLGIPVMFVTGSRFPKYGTMFLDVSCANPLIWNDEDEISWREILACYDASNGSGLSSIGPGNLERYWNMRSFSSNVKQAIRYYSDRRQLLAINEYERLIVPSLSSHIRNAIVTSTLRRITNRSVVKKISKEEDFFFFPLHYEYDAQITFREPFVNQFEIVKALSRALPCGMNLYVKPHPHYGGSDMRFRDLAAMSRLPNVRVVNPSYSPREMIQKTSGVITINSTAGLEALIFDKPLLSFGHEFYSRDDICYLVRDLQELPTRLMEMRDGGPAQPDRDYIKRFVKTIYSNTVFTNGCYGGTPGITREDSEKIAYALNKLLEDLSKNKRFISL